MPKDTKRRFEVYIDPEPYDALVAFLVERGITKTSFLEAVGECIRDSDEDVIAGFVVDRAREITDDRRRRPHNGR